jgi:uncharacterized membrane protein
MSPMADGFKFGRKKSTYREHIENLSAFDRLGLWITKKVGTMWCAVLFALLALISLPAALASGNALIIVAWAAQTFLQLVLLPVIIVGQNLQNRHTEREAQADFETNVEAERRIEQVQRALVDIDAHIGMVSGKIDLIGVEKRMSRKKRG